MIGRLIGAARHPAQLVVAAFVTLITIGTILLLLPWSFDDGSSPGLEHALFWSTSATTVTGIGTHDVSEFSLLGELVLLLLIQLGGFGIMTIGSVLALVASRRIGLRQRMLAQAEIGAVDIGDLRVLISAIAKITVIVEASVAVVLTIRFATIDDTGIGAAAYSGVFHGISAFNNAGVSLYSDNLVPFVGDPFVVFPISIAFILGGLGFPVILELLKRMKPRRWTLHTRITLLTTFVLLAVGPVFVLAMEWSNDATLGRLSIVDKLQAAWFQGTSPRTAGFNTVDIAAMHDATLNMITGLMFIGAGPASTSGGIKVTTFAVIGFAMWAEVRGDPDVNVFRRRLPTAVVRQAMTLALLSVGVVFTSAILLGAMSSFAFTDTLFESASAFGTAGMTTGIAGSLPVAGQMLLVVIMLAGRVGPLTFVTALALRQRRREYRYAEERPIIG